MSSTASAVSRAAVTAAGTTVIDDGWVSRYAGRPAITTAGDLVMTMCPLGASSSIQTQRSGWPSSSGTLTPSRYGEPVVASWYDERLELQTSRQR